MDLICQGCGLRVSAIKVFERSPKTGKGWLITRCPRERCGFNIDIEAHAMPPKREEDKSDIGRNLWRDFL